jgi:hypothetical protein
MKPALHGLKPLGQFGVLLAVAAIAATVSDWPVYRSIPEDAAVVKLSFTHSAGRRSAECRRRTPEELARLPPNMRRPMDCPRERRPVATELAIDERVVFSAELPPSGLSRDGPSQVYRRFVVPAGDHTIVARLRDTPRTSGYDHQRAETVTLRPGQSMAIDFRPELGGFVFR